MRFKRKPISKRVKEHAKDGAIETGIELTIEGLFHLLFAIPRAIISIFKNS